MKSRPKRKAPPFNTAMRESFERLRQFLRDIEAGAKAAIDRGDDFDWEAEQTMDVMEVPDGMFIKRVPNGVINFSIRVIPQLRGPKPGKKRGGK